MGVTNMFKEVSMIAGIGVALAAAGCSSSSSGANDETAADAGRSADASANTPGADAGAGAETGSSDDASDDAGDGAGHDAGHDAGDGAGDSTVGNLGAACTADSDCGGGGLACTLPTTNDPLFGGGPPNGYCTKPCLADSDCTASGLCFQSAANTLGICVLACQLGPALQSLNDPISDPSKCLARPDVACTPTPPYGGSGCLPVCSSDTQCPKGLRCDPFYVECVATVSTGLPTGKRCDPDAEPGAAGACAGECIPAGTGDDDGSFCSQQCVLGSDPALASPLAWTACGGVTNGVCFFPTSSGAGPGDVAFCAAACTRQDGCANPDLFCLHINGLTGTPGIPNGFCLPATPCPHGPADCAQSSGTTCTATVYGPECLDTQFPLGSAAPDGG
jgi:hypothetical protein